MYWLGELLPARKHVETAISLYDRERHWMLTFRLLTFRYGGAHAGITCLLLAAVTLWRLGYPDEALKRGNEALASTRGLSHPFEYRRV